MQTVLTCTKASGFFPRDLVIDDARQSLYVVLATAAAQQPSYVRRFDLSLLPPDGSFDCRDGAVVADGLHSQDLAITLDLASHLWVVESHNTTMRLEPPVLTLASAATPSSIAFFGGTGDGVCVNTSRWTLPSGILASPHYDYNLNGCPDSWEGDGLCDEEYGTGCPAGSDSEDCNSGSQERHNGCDGGSFPCYMLGDPFIALSDGGEDGHKLLRLRIPDAAMVSPDSPTLDVSISELLSNGMCMMHSWTAG